jgi:hypothetical protein
MSDYVSQELNPTPDRRDLGNDTHRDMSKIPPEWGNKSAAAEGNSIISAAVELTESERDFVLIREQTRVCVGEIDDDSAIVGDHVKQEPGMREDKFFTTRY